MAVHTGDKWDAMECIFAGNVKQEVMAQDHEGHDYVAEIHVKPGYIFQCECGNKVTVLAKAFRGKKAYRDCGTCNSAGFSGDTVVMSFSLDSGTRRHIQEYARMDKQSASYIVNQAIKQYIRTRETQAGGNHAKG